MSIDYTQMVTAEQKAAEALADAVGAKTAELREACRSHIVGGVSSDALGAGHTYPTNATDQQNLNGCVTESLLNDADPNWAVPFWCADAAGVWDRRIHTHAQIRAVGTAAAAHVRDAQDMLKLLNDQIAAIVGDTALTDDEKRAAIDLVTW